MAFILDAQREDPDSWQRHCDYLESVRTQFPPGAWDLTTSDWYFSFGDHRCPHDARIESATFSEPATGERREQRTVSLRIRLLSAYHSGYIGLFYPQIFSYSLECADSPRGHGDWRYDEFRLSERGHLLHEIEWWSGDAQARWLIEASDVELRWLPLATA